MENKRDEIEMVMDLAKCPDCGERDLDKLLWVEGTKIRDEYIECQTCGAQYDHLAE